jgi:hypothetical protein
VPPQAPAAQTSPLVQALPSSHGAVLFSYWQPAVGLQLSSVQALPSSQSSAVPSQVPPAHVSPVVHALPSLQLDVLFVNTQPEPGSQLSLVQGFASLQAIAVAMHPTEMWQESAVQEFPSSQMTGENTQPLPGSQESVVQALLSSQGSAEPPWQTPPLHESPNVHELPSLQAALLATCTQPVAGSQESSVHGFPSSQLRGGPLVQLVPAHWSPEVQASPSSQASRLLSQPAQTVRAAPEDRRPQVPVKGSPERTR